MQPLTLTDLDAELTDAIGADADKATFDRIGAHVDRLDTRTVPSLHSAALWYASQGLYVFPLTPRTKVPIKGTNGCLGATDDPDMVNKWWTGQPAANIGLATGHVVDVVDIDGAEGQRSRVRMWADNFEAIDVDALAKVCTPRPGGMHIYLPATGDGNKAGIFPGVDYRGAGGYVVAPPSVNEVGTYRFFGPVNLGGGAS